MYCLNKYNSNLYKTQGFKVKLKVCSKETDTGGSGVQGRQVSGKTGL